MAMKDLIRSRYLEQIRPFYHDGGMIKVLVGIRRCGKSVLMEQIRNELLESGVQNDCIAYLDLDDRMYSSVSTPNELDSAIDRAFAAKVGQRYLFIDEVQNVDGFETTVNAYRNENVSVFITGSNSYLLSGELVTKLTGRYMEFRVLPFSFREVEEYREQNGIRTDTYADFKDYLVYGGFPKRFDYPDVSVQERYVDAVISETKEKDILKRKRVNDVHLLDRMIRFICSVPSAEISSTSTSDYLKKEKINTKPSTVQRYLDLIFSSNISSKCERYDVIGKKALKTLYKSYLSDMSLHTFESGKRDKLDYGMLAENIVYNELISRGYKVMVGKKGPYEIDFVVFSGLKKAYVQVAYSIQTSEVREREERPLLSLNDDFPKYIITADPITIDHDGLHILNLTEDFLLGDGFRI